MKIFALTMGFLVLSSCATQPKSDGWEGPIARVIAQAKRPGYETPVTVGKGPGAYPLLVHSLMIRPLLRESYNRVQRDFIRKTLGKNLDFNLDSRGFARAADRVDADENDPTHYDAVWVRDSLWIYLGLKSNPAEATAAKKLLLALSDYFASPAQAARFDGMIENPALRLTPEGGMNVVHIRFNARSPDFADVMENGEPQTWNHKQNDALGLFLDLFCRAVLSGEIKKSELTKARMAMIGKFPRYFKAVKFDAMVDAGSWEEIERLNTSSVALATSGLERLERAKKYFPKVKQSLVATLIDKGYATIERQLEKGGESPSYAKGDPRYREGDAALLNLIYPAKLSRLKRKHYDTVLRLVAPLVGAVGIKRYIGDSYQSGNFWFQQGKTDDTSTEAAYSDRGSKFLKGTEAQWFFDSWYSVVLGQMADRYHDARYAIDSVKFLNRALAQVTGGTKEGPVVGADGNPVPRMALPESYNTCIDTAKTRVFAPSPITPLNWAKATLRLALARE
jgi:hypothetical protein